VRNKRAVVLRDTGYESGEHTGKERVCWVKLISRDAGTLICGYALIEIIRSPVGITDACGGMRTAVCCTRGAPDYLASVNKMQEAASH